jgi:amino-acid N-acetyltransferase
MPITIRKATQADQKSIRSIVRTAHINPIGLDWRRFVVADEDGHIVATGQVKQHWDGSRELASIATVQNRQKMGLAGRIINTLLEQECGPVYLLCRSQLETFYQRFGFHTARAGELQTMFRLWQPFVRLGNGRIMKRNAPR